MWRKGKTTACTSVRASAGSFPFILSSSTMTWWRVKGERRAVMIRVRVEVEGEW